jgi:hypothetical protein
MEDVPVVDQSTLSISICMSIQARFGFYRYKIPFSSLKLSHGFEGFHGKSVFIFLGLIENTIEPKS